MSQLSDELLVAYIDGQLDEGQASSVTRMIGESGELARRVRRFQHTQARLIDVFGGLARSARTTPVERIAEPRPRPAKREPKVARVAAPARAARSGGAARTIMLAIFLAGLAGGAGYVTARYLRDKPAPAPKKIVSQIPVTPASWATDIGRLHSYFTQESVSVAPESQQNVELVRFQLSKIAHKPVSVPDFAGHGLKFQRGQILSYRGSQLMQLTYHGRGQPLVGLYVMPGGPNSKPSLDNIGDVRTISWSSDGVRYVIAGPLAENALRALAAVAQSQITKG